MRKHSSALAAVAFAALIGATVVAQTPAAPSQKKPAPAKKAPVPAKPVEAPKVVAPPPAPPPPPPPQGVRLKTLTTQGAQVSENVTYIQGPRQRVEFPGVVSIDQCDTKTVVMLNPAAKRYKTQAYAEPVAPSPPPSAPAAGPGGIDPQTLAQLQSSQGMAAQGKAQPKGGVVTVTTTITDTLEREKLFGLDARHVKTTVVKQFTTNACDKSPYKLEMDAWYVDLPERKGCPAPPAQAPRPAAADPNACTDRVETPTVGDAKLGFPVKLTTVTTTGQGESLDIVSTQQEVTELEMAPFPKDLFEIPSDYVEATSSAEIVPAIATGGSLADALFGSTATGTSAAAPKKPGIIRIGVLEPINRTSRTLLTNGHRQELVRKFSKPPYEALPMRGNSVAAIEQDVQRLGVDYVLLTEIVDVKTSKAGKLGGLVSKATKEEQKDKQEVKIDFKLYPANATQAPAVSGSVKGSNGGFTMTSALRLAMFAGQVYMGMGGMFMTGGAGGPLGALGMMNPMLAMSGSPTSVGLMTGLYDPRASAMRSVALSMAGSAISSGMMPSTAGLAGGDPSEAEMLDTVTETLGNEAKAAIEALAKKK